MLEDQLGHSVDLEASRTKFSMPNGFKSWFSANVAALAAKLFIELSNKI